MTEIVLICVLGVSLAMNIYHIFSHNKTTSSFLSHQKNFEQLAFIEQEERRRYLLLAEKAHTAQIEDTGPLTPEEHDAAFGEYDEMEKEAEEEMEILAGMRGGMRAQPPPEQEN